MNKTEMHAYGSELTAAVISEISIWDFTADEAFNEIYHQGYCEEYLVESFEWAMDTISDEDYDFAKSQYPATIQALNHLIPLMSEYVIKKYDMEILL